MAESIFNIVVTGAMNPHIHGPQWYHLNGLITDDQLKQALSSDKTILVPTLVQFSLDKFFIICQDQRWEIRTSDRDEVPGIAEIATKIFETLLVHTPVSACGINAILRPSLADAREKVTALISRLQIDLDLGELFAGEFKVSAERDGRKDSFQVQTADGELVVSSNFHFDFSEIKGFQRLDLSPAFAIAPTLIDDAIARTDSIVRQLSAL